MFSHSNLSCKRANSSCEFGTYTVTIIKSLNVAVITRPSFVKSLPQVNIILLKCYVDKKQDENKLLNINLTNDKTFTFLLSKPIDVFNLAKEKNESFILLDVDFFVFNKFQNLDINKIGFLFYNNSLYSNVNTGLIVSGTQSFECKYFFDLYESFLKLFDNLL